MINKVVNLPNTQSESFKVQLAVGPKKKKTLLALYALEEERGLASHSSLGVAMQYIRISYWVGLCNEEAWEIM